MILTKPQPAFTKERFYLEHAGRHGIPALTRHLNRYKWAALKLKSDDIVLDAGCGSGYGDFILLNACDSVVGVDRSVEAIEYARWKADKQRQARLRYEIHALENLPLDLRVKFDAVVCIEAIEHLKSDAQEMFMNSLKRILKPDGMLLITTPRKNENTDSLKTEFHENEFTENEFKVFLDRFFDVVSFDDPPRFRITPDFMLATCREVRA